MAGLKPHAALDRGDVLWIDGTAKPNPGLIGIGLFWCRDGEARGRQSLRTGLQGCNNEAELRALLLGLEWLYAEGVRRLQIVSDSDFVVRHGRGEQQTRVAPLATLVATARAAMARFEDLHLIWVPRHRNREADTLARQAVGLMPKA